MLAIEDNTSPVLLEWNDLLDEGNRENFELINSAIADLDSWRVGELQVTGIFASSKLAWKHFMFAQSLNYRMVHLVDSICLGWNERRFMGPVLASRAIIETAAILSRLLQKTQSSLESRNAQELDEFLNRFTFQTRDREMLQRNPDLAATNILTEIARLDKRMGGVSAHYERLSELCHPNYSGHVGLFSKLDRSSGTVTFDDDIIERKTLHSVFASLMLTALARADLRVLYSAVGDVADLQAQK